MLNSIKESVSIAALASLSSPRYILGYEVRPKCDTKTHNKIQHSTITIRTHPAVVRSRLPTYLRHAHSMMRQTMVLVLTAARFSYADSFFFSCRCSKRVNYSTVNHAKVIRTHDGPKKPYIPLFWRTILGPDYSVPSPVSRCLRHTWYLVYQTILRWKKCKYYYETDELPNPRPTQPNPRKIRLKVAFGRLSLTEIIFSWVGNDF